MGTDNVTGKIRFFRVNKLDEGYGPANDRIEGEVIVTVDSQPNRAVGIQLRQDANLPTNQAMLKLLLSAAASNWDIAIDFDTTSHLIIRAWVVNIPIWCI